ncbi:MAG: hypothetical protein ACD_21C00250G0020 [uncultured bacterium]|nr:MAG: hypothetical protein ACD_21C00250G0020 [uncultured bacterium]
MCTLVTGAAGFIGAGVSHELLQRGQSVLGIDNLNDYYDVNLKLARIANLSKFDNFNFYKEDIGNYDALVKLIEKYKVKNIVHLAAQAGVRYSLVNPRIYIESNINGFFNVIEAAKNTGIEKFVYASSSSVYGMVDGKHAVSEEEKTDCPASLYAATKRSDELIAYSYARLYGLPCVGLRYFTVYGPWGRPDMAIFGFTQKILSNTPIEIFNNGDMLRDFTYVDDVVSSTVTVLYDITHKERFKQNSDERIPYWIYNVGNNHPIKLLDLITTLEKAIGKEAIKNFLPLQAGDVVNTWANNSLIKSDFHIKISTDISVGVEKFIQWYKSYYNVS